MFRTVEATLEANGKLSMKEKVSLNQPTRVLITFLDDADAELETLFLAEKSLSAGWSGKDADEAWSHLAELPDLDEVAK